jgi:O-antigen/teichoic acid export membrane protein
MTAPSQPIRENVVYSVMDYVSQPAMMLVAAPLLLRALGPQQYGTWMLVNSIAATVSGLGGGFGDGATRYVSLYRGRADHIGAVQSLIAVLVVNCALGFLSAAALVVAAPWLITHAFTIEPNLRHTAVVALQISAALLAVRFAEAVFTSALRGCERYRPMVIFSILARTIVVGSALFLALKGYGLVAIIWSTLAIGIASLAGQASLAFHFVDVCGLWRKANIGAGICEVFSFGAFTWLRSTLGVLVGYADRLLVGALLGTGPLAFYVLCNQLTQTIPALIASAFNFIFPNFSVLTASGRWSETQRSYRMAAAIASLLVFAMSLTVIVFAKLILRLWLGEAAAAQYHHLLIAMAIGNGLLALSVVPHYTALALGRSRALALLNLAAGAVALGCGYFLVQRVGVIGAGFAKILAGAAFLSSFNIVRRALQQEQQVPQAAEAADSTINVLNFAQE